ncbi:DMT family transporter [Sphingomonas sp.]|uniref:DMT family transporter n=1 Tax=Sphingomonas sp. TaxID=28214 RepID=UPI002DB911D3|nr:DMT family transporter [Sphingomonas sp.]HEU4967649.1 DMT family transporter [Sphingomonas sp.]
MPASRSLALPFAAACLGIASYTAMDAVMKGLSLSIGAYNATLWRTIAGSLLGGALFFARGLPLPPRSTLRLHFLRGGIVSVMAILWFWGITMVPLAEAIALSFIAPLIALYLASLILGETIRPQAILGSVLGLSGVSVMLATRASGHYGADALTGAGAILCSAVLYAFNLVLMRKQALVASPIEVGFFQNLTTGLFLMLAAPFFLRVPAAEHFPPILLAASLAVFSLLVLSWAYARAEAQSLLVVEYTGFGWGAFFGWLVFGEAIRPAVLAGTALIILGCYIAVRAPRSPKEMALEANL